MTTGEISAATSETVTAREIDQQPGLWNLVYADASGPHADPALAEFLRDPAVRIVLTGAGTSAFVGEILAPALRRSLRRRVDAVATTDIVADPRAVFAEDIPTLLVSFARSGDSPESTAATAFADATLSTVRHLVITCNADGELARLHGGRADSTVHTMPAAANDRGFAMTSSFSCMLLAAQLLLAPGSADSDAVTRTSAAAQRILDERADAVAALAGRRYRRVVFLGSDTFAGLAREAALKLLELTAGRIVSHPDTPLGFRHGPKAILDDDTLAVVFVSTDPYTRRYDEDIATELRAALGDDHVVAITADGTDATWDVGDLAGLPEPLTALPYVVVAQRFALLSSVELGLTPDNPFPSGELNRVVQGVTIHELPAD